MIFHKMSPRTHHNYSKQIHCGVNFISVLFIVGYGHQMAMYDNMVSL